MQRKHLCLCKGPLMSMHNTSPLSKHRILFVNAQIPPPPFVNAQNPLFSAQNSPCQCTMLDSKLSFRCADIDTFLPICLWKAEWAISSLVAGLYDCLVLLVTTHTNMHQLLFSITSVVNDHAGLQVGTHSCRSVCGRQAMLSPAPGRASMTGRCAPSMLAQRTAWAWWITSCVPSRALAMTEACAM